MFRYRTYQSRFGLLSNSVSVPNGPGDSNTLRPDLAIAQSKGVPFFLYDFARTDLTFQEATGQTLADDPAEAVALALSVDAIGSKTLAQVASEQAEKITNGTFNANLSGWTQADLGTGQVSAWDSNGGGRMALPRDVNPSNRGRRYQTITTVAGRLYQLSVTAVAGGVGLGVLIGSTGVGTDDLSNNAPGVSTGTTRVYYFVAAGVASTITLQAGGTGVAYPDDISLKEIPGNHAIQTGSGTLRPVRQAGNVLRFDAADDNLLTSLAPSGNSMTLMSKLKFGPTTAANQLVMGGSTGASNRCFLSRVPNSGYLGAGVGSNSNGTINWAAGGDMGGFTGVAALRIDGATNKLYWNGVEVFSGAFSGTLGADPLRIASSNNNGAAGNFGNDDHRFNMAILAALTPAEIAQISTYWNSLP